MTYKMASAVYRVISLLVIFTIVLTGFGSALRFITTPQSYNEMTDWRLNITCMADESKYWNKTVQNITIMRQCPDNPIAMTDLDQGLKMGSKGEHMKATGEIDNNSSKSYLTLTITNPCYEDVGSYRCQIIVVDEDNQTIEESVTTIVTIEDQDVTNKLAHMRDYILALSSRMNGLYSLHNETLRKIIQKQGEDVDILNNIFEQEEETNERHIRIKQAMQDPQWKHYKEDNTYIKLFGAKGSNFTRLSWSGAREACKKYGADLVMIFDKRKNAFVTNMGYNKTFTTWIGLKNYADKSYDFRYVNGSKLGRYNPWMSGLPQGAHYDNYDCVILSTAVWNDGAWYDANCARPEPYFCSMPAPDFT